jgi:hypothetical protein
MHWEMPGTCWCRSVKRLQIAYWVLAVLLAVFYSYAGGRKVFASRDIGLLVASAVTTWLAVRVL